jgi:hypothetical protein
VSIEDGEEANRPQRPKVELISTQELKEKLDRGEDFKLVMALGEWEYNAKHIPGSLRLSTLEEAPRGTRSQRRDSHLRLRSSLPCEQDGLQDTKAPWLPTPEALRRWPRGVGEGGVCAGARGKRICRRVNSSYWGRSYAPLWHDRTSHYAAARYGRRSGGSIHPSSERNCPISLQTRSQRSPVGGRKVPVGPFRGGDRGLSPSLLPLFTERLRNGILRSSRSMPILPSLWWARR